MSDALQKAEAAAREAAANTADVAQIVAAVLAAQQAAQQHPVCQHQHQPAKEFDAKKWLVMGGTAAVLALAFALASIAIAIGAVSVTACLLVLRSMWREYQKGR
ncbi:hypothetical protein [Streptomyces griseosporeus]|uniref:hypothetical protein n=1 Tax=Streptomyces griseosporeus TaxID=1910 RepID=UPI00167DCC95|nr:hypothetical protein [Streptomyces griseosporeus]GHF57867.1 hypothetical protein GCM10018783_29060 [Streptomyces griseosporeus]